MTIDSTDSPAPMGGNVIPFGKHKGRLIEELILDDPAYLQWLSAQDWFRTKFTILHQTIINRGSEPEETPDHNAMQVRFLDNAFCLRFLRCLYSNLNDVARERVRMRTDAWQKSVELEYSLSERKQELKRKEDHLRELGRTSLPMEDLPKALSKARSRISELTATIR